MLFSGSVNYVCKPLKCEIKLLLLLLLDRVLDQFVILARVSFMSTALESNSLTLKWLYSEVSSAYWTHSIDGGVTSCKSDTHTLNIIGPRMDPVERHTEMNGTSTSYCRSARTGSVQIDSSGAT